MAKFKVGDRVRVKGNRLNGNPVGFIGNITGFPITDDSCEVAKLNYGLYNAIDELELVEECEPCSSEKCAEPINNNKKSIMSKITTFAKNLTLTSDEKLLRKYGLKNECGEYTDEAEQLVISKLVKENEAYLIEIAKGLELEEKNK